MVAAIIAVAAPVPATTIIVIGARLNRTLQRTIMYTPAVTIVAAWINALTGVGPSIASGNHVYKGICADLPVAPIKSNKVIIVTASPA